MIIIILWSMNVVILLSFTFAGVFFFDMVVYLFDYLVFGRLGSIDGRLLMCLRCWLGPKSPHNL